MQSRREAAVTQDTLVMAELVLTVADRLRGDQELKKYMGSQSRTLKDMLAGRPVRRWRLERLEALCSGISTEAMRRIGSPGCQTETLQAFAPTGVAVPALASR